MQWVTGTTMGCVKFLPCTLCFQVWIERRTTADRFFLRRRALDHTAARIGSRCKIQNAHFLSCICVRCCSFQSALWAYHSLRWFLINPMLWAIPVPSRARETLLRSTGILDCRDQPFVAAVQPLRIFKNLNILLSSHFHTFLRSVSPFSHCAAASGSRITHR